MQAAPWGSTPMTRVPGEWVDIQARQPDNMPPPPTGTRRMSGATPNCCRISRATVPWPAMVRGSSKAGTRIAPDSVAARDASFDDSS